MNENDVREMFQRRESDVHAPPPPPPPLIRRTNLRQFGVVAMATALAVALVAVSIAGIAAMRSPDPVAPAPEPTPALTRTVTLGTSRLTFPTPWTLVLHPGDDPFSTSIQLTNFDPGNVVVVPCGLDTTPFPADGVMLTISVGDDPSAPPWPQQLKQVTGQPSCGLTQLSASWIDPASSAPMTAQATIGSGATEEDELRSVFDSMSFVGFEDQINLGGSETASTLVLAGGDSSGKPWTLGLANDPSNGWFLELQAPSRGSGSGNVETPNSSDMVMNSPILYGNEVVFGAVDPSVTRVQLRPEGRDPFDAELLRVPPGFGAPFTPFVAQLAGAPDGTVVLYDAAGTEIATYRLAPEAYFSARYPQSGDPHAVAPGGSLVDGSENHPWKLAATDTGLALTDETGEIVALIGPPGEDLVSFTTGTTGGATIWLFGIVDPRVTLVQLLAGKDPAAQMVMQMRPLADGNVAFWGGWSGESQIPRGVIVATDADCQVVAAIDAQTGERVDPPTGLSCDAPPSSSP
ncbi:MAG: hypothetical protein ACXWXS_05285 [Actinomycetota bacterium]